MYMTQPDAKKVMMDWSFFIDCRMSEKGTHCEDFYGNTLILNSEHDFSVRDDDDHFGELCGRVRLAIRKTLRGVSMRNVNRLATSEV